MVVVLVLIVMGRYVYDSRTGERTNTPAESTLEQLSRRHKTSMGYLIVIVGIVVRLILIATAHVPCSSPETPNHPVACK